MLRTAQTENSAASLDLVEEIHHRVLNEYAEAIATLARASRGASKVTRSACDSVAKKLHAHATAHRALLPPVGTETVNAGDYVRRVCEAFADASLASTGVRLIVKTGPIHLSPTRCWRLGLIVAELIRNSARHGLLWGTGVILVRLVERSGHISCRVCNTGGSDRLARAGRGQKLAATLARELGGSIHWWLTPQGGTVLLSFPREEADEIRHLVAVR